MKVANVFLIAAQTRFFFSYHKQLTRSCPHLGKRLKQKFSFVWISQIIIQFYIQRARNKITKALLWSWTFYLHSSLFSLLPFVFMWVIWNYIFAIFMISLVVLTAISSLGRWNAVGIISSKSNFTNLNHILDAMLIYIFSDQQCNKWPSYWSSGKRFHWRAKHCEKFL